MNSTALGAESIIFISEAHEKFYYEKLKEVRLEKQMYITRHFAIALVLTTIPEEMRIAFMILRQAV